MEKGWVSPNLPSLNIKVNLEEKDMKRLVGKAKIKINGEGLQREINIYVNENGNLELDGIGSVTYEMWNDELILTKFKDGE